MREDMSRFITHSLDDIQNRTESQIRKEKGLETRVKALEKIVKKVLSRQRSGGGDVQGSDQWTRSKLFDLEMKVTALQRFNEGGSGGYLTDSRRLEGKVEDLRATTIKKITDLQNQLKELLIQMRKEKGRTEGESRADEKLEDLSRNKIFDKQSFMRAIDSIKIDMKKVVRGQHENRLVVSRKNQNDQRFPSSRQNRESSRVSRLDSNSHERAGGGSLSPGRASPATISQKNHLTGSRSNSKISQAQAYQHESEPYKLERRTPSSSSRPLNQGSKNPNSGPHPFESVKEPSTVKLDTNCKADPRLGSTIKGGHDSSQKRRSHHKRSSQGQNHHKDSRYKERYGRPNVRIFSTETSKESDHQVNAFDLKKKYLDALGVPGVNHVSSFHQKKNPGTAQGGQIQEYSYQKKGDQIQNERRLGENPHGGRGGKGIQPHPRIQGWRAGQPEEESHTSSEYKLSMRVRDYLEIDRGRELQRAEFKATGARLFGKSHSISSRGRKSLKDKQSDSSQHSEIKEQPFAMNKKNDIFGEIISSEVRAGETPHFRSKTIEIEKKKGEEHSDPQNKLINQQPQYATQKKNNEPVKNFLQSQPTHFRPSHHELQPKVLESSSEKKSNFLELEPSPVSNYKHPHSQSNAEINSSSSFHPSEVNEKLSSGLVRDKTERRLESIKEISHHSRDRTLEHRVVGDVHGDQIGRFLPYGGGDRVVPAPNQLQGSQNQSNFSYGRRDMSRNTFEYSDSNISQNQP